MDQPKRIIKHLNELKEFECFVNYEREIINNLIDIIKLRANQMSFINRCYDDYFLNLDFKFAYSLKHNTYYEEEQEKIIADFKNILTLITALDLFDDKDLIFSELFGILNEQINNEIDRKNKILIENKKFWEEFKKDIKDYWTNTKNDIDRYKNKISIYKFQLNQRIKKINEFDPY